MAYRVRVTARAERDLSRIYQAKEVAHSAAALKWFNGLRNAILSLSEQPTRCNETRENKQLRQLLYGTKPHVYRTVFRILEKQKVVDILHIRHGARDEFSPETLNPSE
jgi:plasmid stabilization system protein ParE